MTPSSPRRALLATAAVLALGTLHAPAALAQAVGGYPAKAITFVVPFAAGSATDQLARALGQSITNDTKQPVVIDNKAGASGMIAASAVAKSAADGYSVLITTNTTHAANEHLYKKLSYDPVKDFAPVTGLGKGGQVLVVNASAPYKNVGELLAFAKKNPGKLSFGSGSSSSRMAGEMLKQLAAVDILHVPYKSGAPAMTDMMADNLDLVFELMPAIVNHIRSGKLRGLAVTGTTRSSALPELPTVAESGVPNYSFISWFGVFGPAAMPKERVEQINALINKAITAPEFKARLEQMGAEAMPGSSQQFGQFFRGEVDKWAKVVASRKLPPMD